MKSKKATKSSYERMTTERLAEATAEFDHELVADTFVVPPPTELLWFEQTRRKPGRPREGAGARVISVSVERELLERADALARDLGLTRAGLIARGLKAVLVAQGRG